jgi:hypothetical protein
LQVPAPQFPLQAVLSSSSKSEGSKSEPASPVRSHHQSIFFRSHPSQQEEVAPKKEEEKPDKAKSLWKEEVKKV